MNIILFTAILIFIGIVMFILGIYHYIVYLKERSMFVKKIQHSGEESKPESTLKSNNIIKEYLMKIVSSLGEFVKSRRKGALSPMRVKFLQAGYQNINTPIVFFGFKALFSMVLLVGFLLLKVTMLKPMNPIHFIFYSVLAALIGFYLPNLWLKLKIESRKEKIQKGFPDALDLLVVCVEAGMGLDASINRIGEEMRLSNKVLSEEFRLLNLELRAGKSRKEALRNLALRTAVEDVNSLVTLLIQTDKFGTSIAQALRVHSDFMRTKRQQRSEELASKLPVKLVFPLVLFIFPALLITIVGPAVITIIRSIFPHLHGK